MKIFLRRFAAVFAVLTVALLCMGIVYIDNLNHYWRVGGASGQYVQLLVSNKLVITVNTNTGRIGIGESNTNANTRYLVITANQPPTNSTGNGTSSTTPGSIEINGAIGGGSFSTNDIIGGGGGALRFFGGEGGNTPSAVTNATGGGGGSITMSGGGGGGSQASAATNSITGGIGGSYTLSGGTGGEPISAATNTVGGAGGSLTLSGGSGGTPSAGWARKGGNGASATLSGGNGGTGVRTNGGNGANATVRGGDAGSSTSGGNAGSAGIASLSGGAGAASDTGTNSNGGDAFVTGGARGTTSASHGRTILGTTTSGAQRGFVGAGTANPLEWLDSAGNVMARSNFVYTNIIENLATNDTANTNYVWDLNQGTAWVYPTNAISLTNFVNVETNKSKNTTRIFEPQLINRSVAYPTFGGPSFGVRIWTNANSQPWGTFTANVAYAVSITWNGTNGMLSVTEWK